MNELILDLAIEKSEKYVLSQNASSKNMNIIYVKFSDT